MKQIALLFSLFLAAISALAQDGCLYLSRPSRFIGFAAPTYVEINGSFLCNLKSNSAIRIMLPAGQSKVGVRFASAGVPYGLAKATQLLNPYYETTVTIEPGKDLYYQVDFSTHSVYKGEGSDKLYTQAKMVAFNGEGSESSSLAVRENGSEKAEQVLLDPEITYAVGDYIPTQQEGKWGYKQFDKWVIGSRYDQAGPFQEGMALVQLYGKWGFINKSGESVIPFRFEQALPFSEGLAAVRLNGKWGFIDITGQSVIPYKYSEVTGFTDGLAAVAYGTKTGFIDKDDVWYDNQNALRASYRGFAKQYIESRVNEWQKKGRYEKTDAWQARVNDANRKLLIDSLTTQVQDIFIAEQSKNLTTKASIGAYDADNEVFLINDSRFGNMLVHVPLSEAEYFEDHFAEFSRQNRYCVDGDDLGLAEATFSLGNRSYRYNNQASLKFTSLDIDYSFETVDFDATPTTSKGTQSIASVGMSAPRTADVDLNVPEGGIRNENTFAVIIANEQYKREVPVEYAINDGTSFRDYCIKTLGIPEKNVHMATNASYLDMIDQIDWITTVAESYQGAASVIFYYAGHGIPDESSKEAYLLPVDGNGSNVNTGYRLGELYERLGHCPTRSTLVLLDSCFSGSQRDGTMMASARGVAIKAKAAQPVGRMVVLSAAQGDETAYPYREKNHGLFTYFLLKKLQETRGDVTLGELSDYLTNQVGRISIVENGKSQTPTANAAQAMIDEWRTLKLQ